MRETHGREKKRGRSSLNRQWIEGTRFLLLPKNPSVTEGREKEKRWRPTVERRKERFARRKKKRREGN